MNLPSALVYSTRLRVSVYGTGVFKIMLADFLGSGITFTRAARRHFVLSDFGSDYGFACNHLRLCR